MGEAGAQQPLCPVGRSQGGEPEASALRQGWEHTAAPGPGQGGWAGRSGCSLAPGWGLTS